jgi:uncharacterized membrane protein
MLSRLRIGRLATAAAVGAAFAVVAGVAYVTVPDSAGVIHGCYSVNGVKGQGGTALSIVDSDVTTCAKGQSEITWNQVGPEGPAGPQGPVGPQGHAGATGAT